jgi:plasmid maintenance system antidote protein VapI
MNEEKTKLNQFLAENTSSIVFSKLAALLGISKKMLTILLQNPEKLTIGQLDRLSQITGLSIYQLVDCITRGLNELTQTTKN